MPCTESEIDRGPKRGVAETLLHETAGRESTYGDLVMVVAARDRARSLWVDGGDAIWAIGWDFMGVSSHVLA
jgi:hypothetical protein